MTTTPSIDTLSIIRRMASTAALSAAILSPRPPHRAPASEAASVTRTSSMARLRSGRSLISRSTLLAVVGSDQRGEDPPGVLGLEHDAVDGGVVRELDPGPRRHS